MPTAIRSKGTEGGAFKRGNFLKLRKVPTILVRGRGRRVGRVLHLLPDFFSIYFQFSIP